MRTTWIPAITATVAALTLAVTATACGSDVDDTADEVVAPVRWRPLPHAEGSEVPIFIHVGTSGCATLDRIEVDESSDTVTIAAYASDLLRAPCAAVMVEETVTVTLDAPLGDRTLRGCFPADPAADCE